MNDMENLTPAESAWLVTHEELHAKQLAISQKRQQHFNLAMDCIINEQLLNQTNRTPADYTRGYQDAVHGAINIHAYDTCKEYQKGFEAGCMDVRECEALNGEPEPF